MTKPRVFISHSTKEAYPKTLRTEIAQRLRDEGYGVLLDADVLRPGEAWRSTLNLWIGTCDAAVVLLSDAALRSSFVQYELSVLCYRDAFDPSFLLIPVFVDPVDYGAVEKSVLGPSRVTEVQAVQAAMTASDEPDGERLRSTEQVLDDVVAKLAEHSRADSPLEPKVGQLEDLLQGVRDNWLSEELDRLNIDLGPWLPPDEVGRHTVRRLAEALLGSEFSSIEDSLFKIHRDLKQPLESSVREALDLVASSWVSYSFASQLAERVQKQGKASFCMNCDLPITAEMAILRACPHPLSATQRWDIVSAEVIVGELIDGDIEPLERAIREELKHVLKLDTDDELKRKLDRYARRPHLVQVFVTLRSQAFEAATIQQLCDAFPQVRFVFLTGRGDPPPKEVLEEAGVELLRPPLVWSARTDEEIGLLPIDEAAFQAQYDDTRDFLIEDILNRSG